jgi:leucyl aminopeptidase
MIIFRKRDRPASNRLVLLFKGKGPAADDRHLEAEARKLVARILREGLFRGERGEALPLVYRRSGGYSTLVLLGLGEEKKLTAEVVRRAFGALARRLRRRRRAEVVLDLAAPVSQKVLGKLGWEAGSRAAVEGWLLGSYVYDALKTSTRDRLASGRLAFQPGGISRDQSAAARRGARRGEQVAAGVNLARDLANMPGNKLYPQTLAARARTVGRRSGVKCRVLGKRDLEREKMEAFLGVARGSARPPRLIVMEYRPPGATRTLALVGKAVTFDSGGISVKPAKGMEDMKFDMAGGAAVLGAMQVIATARMCLNVVGIIPAAENLMSGSATRPGDVLRSASGKTIEVISTDAEGRLLLADGLHYARRFKPDAVVDLATLTGACVVALGSAMTGLITNDRALGRKVLRAGELAGEPVWELPLAEEFFDSVKSQVADLKNACGREAGASTAGAFLAHFVEGVPWAHLDIAGTGWTRRKSGYSSAGATGVGVRLLTELAAGMEG